MTNLVIQKYLSDESVDLGKRQSVIAALKAGQKEDDIAGMISQKYADKYALTPREIRLSNPGMSPGAEFLKPWEKGALPSNILEAAKTGILKGGEGVQKIGAAITGDTSHLEGYRQFYGMTPEGEVDIKKLSPDERALMGAGGLIQTITGGTDTLASPVTGTIESSESLQSITEPVFGAIHDVTMQGSGMFKNGLKAAGLQLSPEQEAVIDEGVMNLANLLMIKSGQGLKKYKELEGAKKMTQNEIAIASKSGDLGKVKEALTKYEQLVAEKPITSLTGSALESFQGLSASALEGAGIVAPKVGGVALTGMKRMIPSTAKAIDQLEGAYYEWGGLTKPGVKAIRKGEARTAKLDASGTTGKSAQRTLAEAGITPDIEGTKFSTMEQATKMKKSVEPLMETQGEAILALEKISAPVKINALEESAIKAIRTKENVAAGKAAKLEKEIRKEFDTYRQEYGTELPLSVVNDIKAARWKDMKFDFTQPLKSDVNYSIAKTAQKTIEEVASKNGKVEIAQLNRNIGDVLEAAKYLEMLDGNTIKGGRHGKYFAQIGGGIAGVAAGGLVGYILGILGGNIIQELLMKRSVSPLVRSTILKTVKQQAPESLGAVKKWLDSPEAKQKMLPVPKAGQAKVSIETPMELPKRSQSTVDMAESARIQKPIKKAN